MRCPNCSKTMSEIEYEGSLIHSCTGCGGEFIGAQALGHIVRTRDEQFDPLRAQQWGSLQPTFSLPDDYADRLMCCPCCDTAMQVGNYSGDSGVAIDRCTRCGGVWLDREELEKIQCLLERWQDEAPAALAACYQEIEQSQQRLIEQSRSAFRGSRFSFVNAIVNRLLDAA